MRIYFNKTERKLFKLLEPIVKELEPVYADFAVDGTLIRTSIKKAEERGVEAFSDIMGTTLKNIDESDYKDLENLDKSFQYKLYAKMASARLREFRPKLKRRPYLKPFYNAIRRAIKRNPDATFHLLGRYVTRHYPQSKELDLPKLITLLDNEEEEERWAFYLLVSYLFVSETSYQTRIRLLFNLNRILYGKEPYDDQHFGEMVKQVKGVWWVKKTFPLIKDVSIVRNAIAHVNYEINLTEETYTFRNKGKTLVRSFDEIWEQFNLMLEENDFNIAVECVFWGIQRKMMEDAIRR